LAECRDLCERFGVSRTRATIHHWYQSFAKHYEQDFTADPDRIAVDEKRSSSKRSARDGSTPNGPSLR
jgi:transposase-like protein